MDLSPEAYGAADVPDFSIDGYRVVTEFAHGLPSWLQTTMEHATSVLVILLGLFMLVNLWRVRQRGRYAITLALAAPAMTALAYGISELSKTFITQERPCRAVPNAVPSIADCPVTGDWSLPSNHSTIVAAAAVTLVFAWRRAAVPAVLVALLEGFSRVFVGVHYPHDVLAGFLLGGIVAALGMLVTAKVASRYTSRERIPEPSV